MGKMVLLRSLLLLRPEIPSSSLHGPFVRRQQLCWRPNWDGSLLCWYWMLLKHCVPHQNLGITLSTVLSKHHQSRLVIIRSILMIDSQEKQIPVQLTSLTMSSPLSTNQCESIAAVQTTQWSWPPADSEPAVQEVAQPWEHSFVPQGTVLVTVRYPLSMKPTRLRYP